MALNETQFINFKDELKKASEELSSKELIFHSEWIFDLPTQSLEIANQRLDQDYNIPVGWDGYGKDDLNKLEKIGFLKILFESEEDPVTLEKIIKYKIID